MTGIQLRTKGIFLALLILAEVITVPLLNYERIYHTAPFGPPDIVTEEWFIRDRRKLWVDLTVVSVLLICVSTAVIVLMYPRRRSTVDQAAYLTFIWYTVWGLCPPFTIPFLLLPYPLAAGIVFGVGLVIVGCIRREWKYPVIALVSGSVWAGYFVWHFSRWWDVFGD